MPDNHSVEACIDGMQAAWNARSAKAYAALFKTDATNVTFFGDVVFNRADMELKLDDLLKTLPPDMTITMRILRVSEVTGDVRSVVTITGVGFGGGYPLDKLQTITLVRGENGWLCAAFQNTSMGLETAKFYNPD